MVEIYLKILGLRENATLEEIKGAFREKAKLYHPDKNHSPDAHEHFIAVSEAYNWLVDNNLKNSNAFSKDYYYQNPYQKTYSETDYYKNYYHQYFSQRSKPKETGIKIGEVLIYSLVIILGCALITTPFLNPLQTNQSKVNYIFSSVSIEIIGLIFVLFSLFAILSGKKNRN